MAKSDGFEFFGQRWRADIELHACPLEARGFWAELLMVMDQASPRGHLLVNGQKPSLAAIAQLASCTVGEARRCLEILRRFGVSSETDDGVIFSRSMVRESERSERARANVSRRYGNDTDGGTEPATKAATNRATKPATERLPTGLRNPFPPCTPLSPSESSSESSSSASTEEEKRIRARGDGGGGMLADQAVSSLAEAGYRVENRGGNGLKIGTKMPREANPQRAYLRVRKLLVEQYGKDPAAAEMILLAAYSPEMAEHEDAVALCERVSRENRCGWYPDRPLMARQGGAA